MPNQSRLSARRLEKLTHQAKRARHLAVEYSGTLASDLYLEHAKSCEAKAHALQNREEGLIRRLTQHTKPAAYYLGLSGGKSLQMQRLFYGMAEPNMRDCSFSR